MNVTEFISEHNIDVAELPADVQELVEAVKKDLAYDWDEDELDAEEVKALKAEMKARATECIALIKEHVNDNEPRVELTDKERLERNFAQYVSQITDAGKMDDHGRFYCSRESLLQMGVKPDKLVGSGQAGTLTIGQYKGKKGTLDKHYIFQKQA